MKSKSKKLLQQFTSRTTTYENTTGVKTAILQYNFGTKVVVKLVSL